MVYGIDRLGHVEAVIVELMVQLFHRVRRDGRITDQSHSIAQAGGGPFRVGLGCKPVQQWNPTSIAHHLWLDTYPTL